MDKNNIVKIGDFGIAKALSTQFDNASTLLGTPYYMAPEVVKNSGGYNSKADIWSLGCALYEMSTLRWPFEDKSKDKLMSKIMNEECDKLPSWIDTDIAMIIRTCLNKDPNRRPDIWELA